MKGKKGKGKDKGKDKKKKGFGKKGKKGDEVSLACKLRVSHHHTPLPQHHPRHRVIVAYTKSAVLLCAWVRWLPFATWSVIVVGFQVRSCHTMPYPVIV